MTQLAADRPPPVDPLRTVRKMTPEEKLSESSVERVIVAPDHRPAKVTESEATTTKVVGRPCAVCGKLAGVTHRGQRHPYEPMSEEAAAARIAARATQLAKETPPAAPPAPREEGRDLGPQVIRSKAAAPKREVPAAVDRLEEKVRRVLSLARERDQITVRLGEIDGELRELLA
jgi:hypothetical protein